MGKWVDARLSALGARRLAPLGLGDDDGDIDADFESWRAFLWAALCGRSDQADGQEEAEEEAPAPSYVAVVAGGVSEPGSDEPPLAWLGAVFPKQRLAAGQAWLLTLLP